MTSLSLIILDSAHEQQTQELLKAWMRMVNMQAGNKEPQGGSHRMSLALKGVEDTYEVHTGACLVGGEGLVDGADYFIKRRLHQARYQRLVYAVVTSMSHPDDPEEAIVTWGVRDDLQSEWRPTGALMDALRPLAGLSATRLALLEAVMPYVIDVPALARVRTALQSRSMEQTPPSPVAHPERKPRM